MIGSGKIFYIEIFMVFIITVFEKACYLGSYIIRNSKKILTLYLPNIGLQLLAENIAQYRKFDILLILQNNGKKI